MYWVKMTANLFQKQQPVECTHVYANKEGSFSLGEMQKRGVYWVTIFAGYTLLVEMLNFISLCTIPLCTKTKNAGSFLSAPCANQKLELSVYPSLVPTLGLPQIQRNE